MTVRQATVADEAAILSFLVGVVLGSEHARRRTPCHEHVAAGLTQMLAMPQAVFLLAENPRRLVGLFVLIRSRDLIAGTPLLTQVCLYVAPGSRRAAGNTLMLAGEALADEEGATLQTLAPTTAYSRLYRRRGYAILDVVCERSPVCRS